MRTTYIVGMGRRRRPRHLKAIARHWSPGGAKRIFESELTMLIADHDRPDRAPQMPLLGLLSGLTLALVLWSGIAWLVLNVLG